MLFTRFYLFIFYCFNTWCLLMLSSQSRDQKKKKKKKEFYVYALFLTCVSIGSVTVFPFVQVCASYPLQKIMKGKQTKKKKKKIKRKNRLKEIKKNKIFK